MDQMEQLRTTEDLDGLGLTDEYPDIVMKTISERIGCLDDINVAVAFGEFITEEGLSELKASTSQGLVAGVTVVTIEPTEMTDIEMREGEDQLTIEIYVAANDKHDHGFQHWRAFRGCQAIRHALQGRMLIETEAAMQSSPFEFVNIRRYLSNQMLGSYIVTFRLQVKHGNEKPDDLFSGDFDEDFVHNLKFD